MLIFLILIFIVSLFTTKKIDDNIGSLTPTITPIEKIIPIQSPIPTISLSVKQINEIKIQQQADTNFGQWQKEINDNKPWYDKLPLQTDKYFVYFDLKENKFIGQIYVKENQEGIQKDIIDNLKSIGVKTENYIFEWNIK